MHLELVIRTCLYLLGMGVEVGSRRAKCRHFCPVFIKLLVLSLLPVIELIDVMSPAPLLVS